MEYAKRYIGLLVPSADFVVEQDFKNTLPPHVGTYASRMFHGRNPKSTIENLQKILDAAEGAAELVSHANPEVVIFCGTSASFMHGKGSDDELSKRLSKAAGGIPATNTTSAAVAALKALNIKKLFFYSPYPLPAHQRGVKFFGDHGFEVVDNDTFQCVNSLEIPALQPNDIVTRLARHKETLKRCDGVFASCTNFRVLPVIEPLEKEYGIPIVSANQATIWSGLRHIKEPTNTVKGAGSLFQAG